MPRINLGSHKRREPAKRSHAEVYNNTRWRKLRMQKLMENPLCELCELSGKVSIALEVHHVVPVESVNSPDEITELTYDWDNLQSLCKACHLAIHTELRRAANKNRKR